MKNTVLQIPLSKELRQSAEKASENLGFFSLQETVRVLLTKLSSGQMSITFEERFPEERLSAKAARRYDKMIEEMKSGKNVYKAESVNDFLKQLKSA